MTSGCSTCGEPLVAAGAGGESEHGTVAGTLDGPRRWRCPAGHETRAIDADAATDEVLATLDVAERTRLRGTLRCAACHTPYALPGRRATRSVTVTEAGVPATRFTFDLPVLRCTEDAVQSLPPECVDDLRAVVADLAAP